MGHPAGNKWYDLAPKMGPRPADPTGGEAGRRHLDAERIPQYVPPAVTFPYKKMGQSAYGRHARHLRREVRPLRRASSSSPTTRSASSCGPTMEKVNGVYQGACFPFRQGFATGLIGGTLTDRGQMFVGGSKRGWPVRGLAEKAFQRLDWTGKTPFEVQTIRAKPDGFDLRFTAPVDASDRRPGQLHARNLHAPLLRRVRRPGDRAGRPAHRLGHAEPPTA